MPKNFNMKKEEQTFEICKSYLKYPQIKATLYLNLLSVLARATEFYLFITLSYPIKHPTTIPPQKQLIRAHVRINMRSEALQYILKPT